MSQHLFLKRYVCSIDFPVTSLLDLFYSQIRAKEAAAIAKELTRKPEDERKLMMLKKLPELVRIIDSYFVSERRSAIPFEDVIQKTIESYHTSISVSDVQELIQFLAQLLPDWICILEVRKGTFVKVDKNKTIVELLERLNKHEKQIKIS